MKHLSVIRKLLPYHGVTAVKILRIMKMTAVLLTVFSLSVSAGGYSQTITISAKQLPLDQVFTEIQKQTGYGFVYRWELLQQAKPVDLQVRNMGLKEVLDICFKDQPLDYKIVEKTIIVNQKEKAPVIINPPPVTDVRGRVVNEKGEPVAGASVQVKGDKTKGTSTDANGNFELKGIEEDAVLVISGVSIETIEIRVRGNADLGTISTKIKVGEGEEVIIGVNTGYQTISKERFVGSVSQMDSAAFHRRDGPMGILERLDGNVTGLLIDKKTQGNTLQNIQVRGLSTINASRAPLIIVDNFPFPLGLENINPNDVESITVLKDAAATSIWGARAGNGVIVITTQKGKYNQPLRVSVSSNITINDKPDLYYYPQISVPDFVDAEAFLFNKGFYNNDLLNTNSWPVISPVVEMLAKRRAGKVSAADSAIQMNAFKEMDMRRDLDQYAYRHAISQQHYINVSGGNDLISYAFSAGYNRNINNVQHSMPDDNFTVNSATRLRPLKNFEISNTIRYTQSMGRSTSFLLPGKIYPYMQLADAEGHPLAVPYNQRLSYVDTVGGGQLLDWRFRPLDEPRLADNKTTTRAVVIGLDLSYRINNWLNASVNYQYGSTYASINNYNSLQSYFTRNQVNLFTNLSATDPALRHPIPVGGILDVAGNSVTSQNARAQLEFRRNVSGKHYIGALLSSEVSEAKSEGSRNSFYNYDKETGTYQQAMDYLNLYPVFLGGTQRISSGDLRNPAQILRFASILGNISYTYNSRYTLYASARKDGSNVFGVKSNNKWKPLWSVGANWDISEERFYDIQWMPDLHLRISYGYAGNRGPANVTGFPIIYYSTYPAPLTNALYASPRDAPNPDLRWEKVETVNAGVDFSLVNKRIIGSVDIWQKKSTDLISGVPFAPATGVLSFTTNSANLKGKGFDLSLSSININRKFIWQSSFGLSHAKTKVTKLLDGRPHFSTKDFIQYSINAWEGQLVYGLSSFKWVGLDANTGDPRGFLGKQISTNYASIFNDSLENQVFHGSSIPLYWGFFGNSFSWKGFTLSANITYRFDFYFRKPTINYSLLASNWRGHSDYALRWQQPGDEQITSVPSFAYPLNSERDLFYQYSEVNVLRGDNIRLQDIRLQYNWVNTQNKRIPFKNITVFVYANNLNVILWRKNKVKLDPDFTGGSSLTATPTAKTWTGGIALNF